MIQVDDFDIFKERMLGSQDKKPRPHKRALLFVDNSGADVILGMLPLARELLRRGTEVHLLHNAVKKGSYQFIEGQPGHDPSLEIVCFVCVLHFNILFFDQIVSFIKFKQLNGITK